MFEIRFNDQPLQLAAETSLATLLSQQKVSGRFVAVAVNGVLVPAAQWQHHVLSADDAVLVVGAIQGG